jgi:hypothetical protein
MKSIFFQFFFNFFSFFFKFFFNFFSIFFSIFFCCHFGMVQVRCDWENCGLVRTSAKDGYGIQEAFKGEANLAARKRKAGSRRFSLLIGWN